MADQDALVPVVEQPEGMARLNITYGGQQGDLPDPVPFDMRDNELKQIATESVRAGSVPGIDGTQDVNFNDFVVDRFPAREDVPFNRLSLRPKTPFGAMVGIGSTIVTKDGKYTFVIHPTNQAALDAGLEIKTETMEKGPWFDTVDDSKKAGSMMLDRILGMIREKGAEVYRTGDLHHVACRSYPNCEKDQEGCEVAKLVRNSNN